ncbi:MAG TPA: NAD(P)-dependent oxidoreductase [Gallionellaceae bacterium]|nr:NAD(P)-dependent oxidoreductase [Gallionellaceae bacterium]
MVVMAARGRDSFSMAQLQALEAHSRLTVHVVPQRLSHEEMRSLCAPAAIIGFTRRATIDFNAKLIDELPNLRAVAVYATGYDWIDIAALERRGIRLALLPDYSTQTVAEHSLALILNMSRRLHLSDRIARGTLPGSVSLRGFELHGKTLGIIGLGRIGRAIARMARAFGMRIIANDIAALPAEEGIAPVGLPHLLATADIVLLASSLKRGAPPLIDAEALARMKPGALLINPSRSALVDNAAVVQAIATGHLRGYAVDDTVFDAAQLARVEHGRILQSAHTAWYSDEAIARGTQAWVDNLTTLAREHHSPAHQPALYI